MAFTLPTNLKLAHLKQLAFKCGISTSGTKPILSARILDSIARSHSRIFTGNHVSSANKKKDKPIRILSIDMGIRNLAYCILDFPPSNLKSKAKKSKAKMDTKPELPTIQSWHRLAVSSAPTKSSADEELQLPVKKEAFDPLTLSQTAYNLLRHRLLLQNPTHILIERQRFRSMGSKHILEWTIRVNMFESILYGVLCTLKAEGVWEGEVEAILPGKVGPFWIGEEGEGKEKGKGKGKERKSKNAKVRNKGLKIDLVRRWLDSGEVVMLGNEAVEGTARAYREKWDRLPGRQKGGKKDGGEGPEETMGKLDDLADCLLQGMAWIQWEENKRIALTDGVEALLEP